MLEDLSIRACTERSEVLKARDGCGERKNGKPQAGTPPERSEGSSSGEEGRKRAFLSMPFAMRVKEWKDAILGRAIPFFPCVADEQIWRGV